MVCFAFLYVYSKGSEVSYAQDRCCGLLDDRQMNIFVGYRIFCEKIKKNRLISRHESPLYQSRFLLLNAQYKDRQLTVRRVGD